MSQHETEHHPVVVQATLDDLAPGQMVYNNKHGHSNSGFLITKVGVEAKVQGSDPKHNWVVLNDAYFYLIEDGYRVVNLWRRQPNQE